MSINLVEDALIAFSSESKRPLAALHSMGRRHADNVDLDVVVKDDGKHALVLTSLGGVWSARRWRIVLPLEDEWCADLVPKLLGDEDSLSAPFAPNAKVSTTSRNGEGTVHDYEMSWTLTAYYVRGALIRQGEYSAVTDFGDPSRELGGYVDPVAPKRDGQTYLRMGYARIKDAPETRLEDLPALEPRAERRAAPEPEPLAEWEVELLNS